MVFPRPGPYRVLVDVYPQTKGPGYTNFQLFQTIHVSGAYHPIPLPPYKPVVTTGRWTFTIKRLPKLHLAQAALIDVSVRDAAGHPAEFTPWFGAMGHAIFFHQGDLAYFHTHICAPHQAGCAVDDFNVGQAGGFELATQLGCVVFFSDRNDFWLPATRIFEGQLSVPSRR